VIPAVRVTDNGMSKRGNISLRRSEPRVTSDVRVIVLASTKNVQRMIPISR